LMLLSTDEVIAGLLARKSPQAESDLELVHRDLGVGLAPFQARQRSRPFRVIASLILLGCLGLQLQDTWLSWSVQRDNIDFFRDNSLVELHREDLRANWDGCPLASYDRHNRSEQNDDLGERSDVWQFAPPEGVVTISFDQKFPGWHELTRCYRNAGWQATNRLVHADGEYSKWPIVTVELKRQDEAAFLMFALVDHSSQPLTPPGAFNDWTILRERLRARLTPTVRAALLGKEAFQIQCLVPAAELSEAQKSVLLDRFVQIRDQLWERAKQRMREE
jgi:hypothetical protein